MSYDPNLAFLQTENSNLYWQDIQNSRERGQLKAQINQIHAYYQAELVKVRADLTIKNAEYERLSAAKAVVESRHRLAIIAKDEALIAKERALIAKDEELLHEKDNWLHTEIDRRCAKMSSYDYSEQLQAVLDSLKEELPPETVNQVVNKAQLKFFRKVNEVGHRYGNGVDLSNPNRFKTYGYYDKLEVPDWLEDQTWHKLSDTMDVHPLAIEITENSLFHYTTDDPLLKAEFEALTGQSLKSTSSHVADLLTHPELPVVEPQVHAQVDPFEWLAMNELATAEVEPEPEKEKPSEWVEIDPFEALLNKPR